MPARLSSETKRMRGTLRPCRERNRDTLARLTQLPRPPRYLSANALIEWQRIAPEALRVGMSTADVRGLALLCETLATAEELAAVIRSEGCTVESASGGRKGHPAITALGQARAQALNMMTAFGLNPRGRQSLPPAKPVTDPNPFANL